MRKTDLPTAFWGTLCAAHREMVAEGFETIPMSLVKLSGFMVVCKAMLDLGPEWLDRYVRTLLAEGYAMALEEGIVAGTGKDMPMGMMKDMEGGAVAGVYPDKTPVILSDLTPKTLGQTVMSPLTRNGKREVDTISNIILTIYERYDKIGMVMKNVEKTYI